MEFFLNINQMTTLFRVGWFPAKNCSGRLDMFDETAEDFFQRIQLRPLRIPFPFIQSSFPNGVVLGNSIEAAGASGTGKSQLLLSMCSYMVLPEMHCGLKCGGNGVGVIYIDVEGHFDVFRLVSIMEGHLEAFGKQFSADQQGGTDFRQDIPEYNALLKVALSRVHVIRPKSTLELLCAIKSAPPEPFSHDLF